jgi:site-specific recombinase XerD
VTTLLESWAYHLGAENRSPNTISSYRLDTQHLLTAMGAADEDALLTIERRTIEKHLTEWLGSGLAPATVARRFRSLQQLFRWLDDEGELPGPNPMAKMKPPHVPEQPPDVLTDAEQAALVRACRDRQETSRKGRQAVFEAKRDTAMVLILLNNGVRAAELMGLTVEDVHMDVPKVVVLGKGGRYRNVPLLPQTAEFLDRYLRARRRHPHAALPALWLGEKGPLTDSGLRQMLERRCRNAEIRNVNPHLFRHTWAHTRKGADLSDEVLMALGGWKSPQMLQRYGASAKAERAKDAHERAFGSKRY